MQNRTFKGVVRPSPGMLGVSVEIRVGHERVRAQPMIVVSKECTNVSNTDHGLVSKRPRVYTDPATYI